jgi:predicted acylesterase/phospholipase RssA
MSLNNLELNSNKEDASNSEEQIINNEEDTLNNEEELIVNNKEDTLNNKEEQLNNKEEQLNNKEEQLNNKEEHIVNNQEKISPKITTLCFSGGGIKGFSFIGALECLIEKKIINLTEIKCFVGTSIGAMLSFLLILGWEIEEMKDFIFNFNFSKLKGEINSIAFFQNLGIQDGERFKLLLINFLETKLNVKDITFEELYKLTNKKLIIIGTNLTKGKEVVFNYKTTPHFSVILALRISTAVPIIFSPIIHENEIFTHFSITRQTREDDIESCLI